MLAEVGNKLIRSRSIFKLSKLVCVSPSMLQRNQVYFEYVRVKNPSELRHPSISSHAFPSCCFFRISPAGAGINAPGGGLFLLLNSSHICPIVTHSTPSCLLMCSIILQNIERLVQAPQSYAKIASYLSCMRITCGLPETSGCMVIGKMNSSYSRQK